jgi:hypothetical protein
LGTDLFNGKGILVLFAYCDQILPIQRPLISAFCNSNQIRNGVDGAMSAAVVTDGASVRGKDRFCGRFFAANNAETTNSKTVCCEFISFE